MAEKLDLCDIQGMAKALDVHRGDGTDTGTNPSSILGTDTVAPLTMATAYAGIANQGLVCSPVAIDKIVTSTGKQVNVPASDCKQGVPKNIAIAAGYTLHGVFGGGGTAAGDEGPLNGAFGMVKTGTTDNATNTWEVGGTTKTTTAVWVGNVNGGTNLRNVYSFPGCEGTGQAANARHCIWQEIAGANAAKYPGDTTWPTPDAQFLYGQQISVPNVAGLSMSDATSTAAEGRLHCEGRPRPALRPDADRTGSAGWPGRCDEPRRGHGGDARLCRDAAAELRPVPGAADPRQHPRELRTRTACRTSSG